MVSPGTPRFRFLARDGTEVMVASVEELSARLEAGELGPETSLFDAGTGRWARAGDVPVFQFVREELRAEGRLPEEEPELIVFPDAPPSAPIEPPVDFEPIEHEDPREERPADQPGEPSEKPLPPRPLAPPTVDPFEFHLPLSNPMDPLEGRLPAPPPEPTSEGAASMPPDGSGLEDLDAPDLRETGDGDEVEDGDVASPEPWFEDRRGERAEDDDDEVDTLESRMDRARSRHAVEDPDIDASPLHAWLTQGATTSEGPPPPATEPPAGGRGPAPMDRDAGPPDEEPPLQIRTAWEDAAEAPDPRAAWIAARRQRRNVRVMAGAAALLILIVGGAAIVTGVRTDVNEFPTESGGAGSDSPGGDAAEAGPAGFTALEGVELPPGLEGLASLLWQDLPGQIDLLVDSLRVEAGVADAPPREWLGGAYLAGAGEFGDVVEFWEAYGRFVESLASRDAELLREAAIRILEGRGPGRSEAAFSTAREGDRDRLLAYVMARHERMRDARLDRYLHLGRTARAALDLHSFLERNTDAIVHAPAIGRGVSSDPVLEAVTETPEVRREMERHLDLVFAALDRTRRGGQPSLAGLRVELFESLGRPL